MVASKTTFGPLSLGCHLGHSHHAIENPSLMSHLRSTSSQIPWAPEHVAGSCTKQYTDSTTKSGDFAQKMGLYDHFLGSSMLPPCLLMQQLLWYYYGRKYHRDETSPYIASPISLMYQECPSGGDPNPTTNIHERILILQPQQLRSKLTNSKQLSRI